MKRPIVLVLAVLAVLAVLVSAACAAPPTPTASPAPTAASAPAARCVGISATEADICGRMVALLQRTHPEDVRDASRILVVDTCPEQVLCDRLFLYDAIALVVPPDGSTARARAFRIFGHQAQPLSIEIWSDPLPAHVASVLAEG